MWLWGPGSQRAGLRESPLPSCLPHKWLHLAGPVSQPHCTLHLLYSLTQCQKCLSFLPKLWRPHGPRNNPSTWGGGVMRFGL